MSTTLTDLNVLVAQARGELTTPEELAYGTPRPYQSSIADAWELVEEMRDMGSDGHRPTIMIDVSDDTKPNVASCRVLGESLPNCGEVEAYCPTVPEAICRAYLKAKGVEVPS